MYIEGDDYDFVDDFMKHNYYVNVDEQFIKKSNYGRFFYKQVREDQIHNKVIKTTPQTLTDTDKNQALANLGIDPIVWKYICNPFILQTGRELPDELLTEDRQDFKYKIDGMYRWVKGFTSGSEHNFNYAENGDLNGAGIVINMGGGGNELIDDNINDTNYYYGDAEWDDYFSAGGWAIRDGKCYIQV